MRKLQASDYLIKMALVLIFLVKVSTAGEAGCKDILGVEAENSHLAPSGAPLPPAVAPKHREDEREQKEEEEAARKAALGKAE